MRDPAQVQLLPDGRRLHLADGPIDLILEAFGAKNEVRAAYQAAAERFLTVLEELCGELPLLRQPLRAHGPLPTGKIAKRMAAAVAPYAERTFITPMAAVAGAVAEEILAAMTTRASLERAYANNGGDIAIHLQPGQSWVVGMVERPDRPSLFGSAVLAADQPVRGIATSGWRGRSFSLGIADAVTVLAKQAARADAAATIIANAVDLPGHPRVRRARACDLAPDNDLGERLVTQDVGALTEGEIRRALDRGEATARLLLAEGLVCAVALHLGGTTRTVSGALPSRALPIAVRERSFGNA
jgi:uncharacterized protein